MRQLLPSGKNGNYFFQGIYVFALCLSQLVIFLKLIRPLNTSQRLSSLKSSSTFAALCRPRPFLESLNTLAVSSLGISTSKGIPRRRIICLKYRVIASDIERPRQFSIFLACSLLFASILVFIVVVIFILPDCSIYNVLLLYIHRLYIKYTFLFDKKQCCLSIKLTNIANLLYNKHLQTISRYLGLWSCVCGFALARIGWSKVFANAVLSLFRPFLLTITDKRAIINNLLCWRGKS